MRSLCLFCLTLIVFSVTSPSQASTWNDKTNQAPHTLGLSLGNVTGPTYSYSAFSFLELNGMIDAQWILDDRSSRDDTKTISDLVGATATIPLTRRYLATS